MNTFQAWLTTLFRVGLPDRLAMIGGADREALKVAPTTRMPFQAIGCTLIVTAGVAVLSMGFALHDAIGINAGAAVPVALGWGLVIFTLDRMLISVSMGSGVAAVVSTTLVRLAIAVLIGFMVSTPLVLRAFDSDIALQLGKMRLENAASIQQQIDEQKKVTVDKIQADIDVQNNILQGVLPPGLDTTGGAAAQAADSAVPALQPQLEAAKHAADQAAILVSCEGYGNGREKLDHPEKCASKPGFHGNYDLYVNQAKEAADRLATIQAEVDAAQARVDAAGNARARDQKQLLAGLQAQAPAELDRLNARKADAQATIADLQKQLDGVNKGNDGLLARLEALGRAGHDKPTLQWAHLLLALLFCAVEMAPVLGKTMFSLGKQGATYDQALALVVAGRFNKAVVDAEQQHRVDVAEAEGRADGAIAVQAQLQQRVDVEMLARGQREIDTWVASLP